MRFWSCRGMVMGCFGRWPDSALQDAVRPDGRLEFRWRETPVESGGLLQRHGRLALELVARTGLDSTILEFVPWTEGEATCV